MRYMALQGDQGWLLFRWIKRGAIIWCLPSGPKSRSQVLESSWGMLSTWPEEQRAPVSRSLPAPALLQGMRELLGAVCFDKSEAMNSSLRACSVSAVQLAICREKQPKLEWQPRRRSAWPHALAHHIRKMHQFVPTRALLSVFTGAEQLVLVPEAAAQCCPRLSDRTQPGDAGAGLCYSLSQQQGWPRWAGNTETLSGRDGSPSS